MFMLLIFYVFFNLLWLQIIFLLNDLKYIFTINHFGRKVLMNIRTLNSLKNRENFPSSWYIFVLIALHMIKYFRYLASICKVYPSHNVLWWSKKSILIKIRFNCHLNLRRLTWVRLVPMCKKIIFSNRKNEQQTSQLVYLSLIEWKMWVKWVLWDTTVKKNFTFDYEKLSNEI